MTTLTKEQRLARFRQAAMIIGGCRTFDERGELIEEPGWQSRFADAMGMDRGNLGKLLSGQRVLSTAMEDRLEAAIRSWRDREVTFLRRALLLGAQIDAERNAEREAARQAEILAAQLTEGLSEDDTLTVSPRDARALQRAHDMGLTDGRAVYSLDDAPDHDDDGPEPQL